MIWHTRPDMAVFETTPDSHIGQLLDIQLTEVGDDYISASMPVDHRTRQPYGILHGGASCVLAETLGSVAGSFVVDMSRQMVVGLEINANHISPVREGLIIGTARPIHLGQTTQVWDIRISTPKGTLVCISRLTLAVRDRKGARIG
jgi:1,4-dihydroxy-2-naphthoyl-CoA hydrolase